jgi:hypothetical protein
MAKQPRIFEYVDEEGNTFYSFAELKGRVSSGKILVLQNRLGKPFLQFLQTIKREVLLFFDAPVDEEIV